ncbi:hypothetical protein ACWGBV_01015 [Streptomyces sp. NPDC055051]
MEFLHGPPERGTSVQASVKAIEDGAVPRVADWDVKTAKYWEELVNSEAHPDARL